jgi:hypothetical protein
MIREATVPRATVTQIWLGPRLAHRLGLTSTYQTIHYKKIVGNGIHFASHISPWIGVDVTLVRVGPAGPKIKHFCGHWRTIVFQSE